MKITRRTVVQSILGGLGLAESISQSSGEWRYDYNRAFRLPTVYEGVAYVVGGEGALHAIDVDSGTREWIFDEWNVKLDHEVTVVDGICFVSDYGARGNESLIRMIDVDGGELLGTLPVAINSTNVNPGPPLVYDGICYVQTTEALVAIDYLNEEVIWSDERCGQPSRISRATLPAIENATVVAQSGRALHAFDALTGEYRWTAPHEPSTESKAPVIENGDVFLSLGDALLCVNLASGDTKWRYQSAVRDNAPVPVVYDNIVIMTGSRRPRVHVREGVAEAIDFSEEEPIRRWTVTHGSHMRGEGTISDDTFFVGTDNAIIAISIETGKFEVVKSDKSFDTSYQSVLLGDDHLFSGMQDLSAINLEDLEDEYGSRGYHASNAHHDGWAEQAALNVASLEVATTPETPRIGDDVSITVTVQLESGIEANVTGDSILEVNPIGTVDENGTIQVEDSGEMTVAATYAGQTTNRTITVPAEETADDEVAEDDDDALGSGIITVATAIGGAAYWLSRRSGAIQ